MSGRIIQRVRERQDAADKRGCSAVGQIRWLDALSASMNRQCFYPTDPPWTLLLRRRLFRLLRIGGLK